MRCISSKGQALCKKKRIDGAYRLVDVRAVPEDAEKPIDGRTNPACIKKQDNNYAKEARRSGDYVTDRINEYGLI